MATMGDSLSQWERSLAPRLLDRCCAAFDATLERELRWLRTDGARLLTERSPAAILALPTDKGQQQQQQQPFSVLAEYCRLTATRPAVVLPSAPTPAPLKTPLRTAALASSKRKSEAVQPPGSATKVKRARVDEQQPAVATAAPKQSVASAAPSASQQQPSAISSIMTAVGSLGSLFYGTTGAPSTQVPAQVQGQLPKPAHLSQVPRVAVTAGVPPGLGASYTKAQPSAAAANGMHMPPTRKAPTAPTATAPVLPPLPPLPGVTPAVAATAAAAPPAAAATPKGKKTSTDLMPPPSFTPKDKKSPNPKPAPPCSPATASPGASSTASKRSASGYELSPYHASDSDYDSDEAREAKRGKIPIWAKGEALDRALINQERVDPDAVFGQFPKSCDLDKIFEGMPKKKKKYLHRGSSGNWDRDTASWKEELEYRRAMGFVPK